MRGKNVFMNGGMFFLLLHCQFFPYLRHIFRHFSLAFRKMKIEGIKGVSPSLSLLEYFEFLGFDLMVHHPCADLFESDWLASRHEYHVNVRKQEHKVMRKLINFRRFSLFSWMCLLRVFALFSFACSLFHLALRSRIHQGGKISFLLSSPPLSLKRDIKYATRLFLWRALQVLLVSDFKGDLKFMKLEEFVWCFVCLHAKVTWWVFIFVERTSMKNR